MCDRTTVRPTVQGATFSMRGQLYHGHYLIISPLHGHGEVANENPLILPRTLSVVGALVTGVKGLTFTCFFQFGKDSRSQIQLSSVVYLAHLKEKDSQTTIQFLFPVIKG